MSNEIRTTNVNEDIEKAYGYSVAARIGNMLYIGGLVSWDEQAEVIGPNDAEVQARNIYDQIKEILASHDASFRNVVSETIYVTDWDLTEPAFEIRKQYYDNDGAAYPSAAAVQVAALIKEGLLYEVQMVAQL